jgi:hypothetical protein
MTAKVNIPTAAPDVRLFRAPDQARVGERDPNQLCEAV